jgi:enterochelin esterase family protein
VAPPSTAPCPEIVVPNTIDELRSLFDAIEATDLETARALGADLMGQLEAAGRIPFTEGDQVLFLYLGDAESVEWRGDFTGWDRGRPVTGRWLSGSNIWHGSTTIPADARALYKVVVDADNWILDPANSSAQLGGLGTDSMLTMPDHQVTDLGLEATGVTRGVLSDPITLDSAAMGYAINYQVYTPPGVADLANLPAMYVTDGSDFSHPDMGGMPAVFDNLLAADLIEPVIVVFVDAWDPAHTENRREVEFLERPRDYADFLADELVPAIDAAYPTAATRESRTIVGTSYGGVGAVNYLLLKPEVFSDLGMYSPAFWVLGDPAALGNPAREEAARDLQQRLDNETGQTDAARVFLTHGIPEWDVGDLSPVVAMWEEQGLEHAYYPVQEGHNWASWRGTTDEMLEYFYGS